MTHTWDDVRRLVDQVELKVHLGGMEARDRWHALQQRVRELDQLIARAGKHVGTAIDHEIASLGEALQRLHDDVS